MPIPTLESPLETPVLPEVPPHPDESVGRRGWRQAPIAVVGMPGVPLSSENCSTWERGVGSEPPRRACQALNQLALGPLRQMRINLPPWVGYANTLYPHELQG